MHISKVEETFKEEEVINELQKSIINYLLKLSKTSLDEEVRESVDLMFNTINDIERIGDHADNIAELAQNAIESSIELSEEGKVETKEMYDKIMLGIEYTLKSLETKDKNLAKQVFDIEDEVDSMEKSFKANHRKRLNENKCSIG